MTCREFAEFILDYLDGSLSADVRERFEHHLELCANCVEYLAQYRTATEAGQRLLAEDDAPLPVEVPEGLVKAILAARKR